MAIRWYEIRNISTTPTLFQQGTYDPNTDHHWMGSIAMDAQGNMALGYSVSSTTTSPSVRYTGRLVADPAGTLPQGEGVIINGASSQTGGSRWGDYSDMTVDPTDDCTFWYTQEYLIGGNWATRIGSFKFPTCVNGAVTPTNTPAAGTATPTSTNTPVAATATPTACAATNLIINAGFETGTFTPWVVDSSAPAPVVSNLQAHTGTFSGHVGSFPTGETPGDSSFYQTVIVPPSGGTLSFWYWPRTIDSVTFDWQDAYITDNAGVILATIFHQASNSQTWTNQTFNMNPYSGQTVRVKFLVHGDNAGDPTDMFVDDVQLLAPCLATATSTSTATIGATATPCPPINLIVNGGFETGAFPPWTIDSSAPPPFVATTGGGYPVHSGLDSGHVGSLPAGETPGDSSFYQTVVVPATGGTLSFWYWPRTTDSVTFDWQDAYVTDAAGTILATIFHQASNAQTWINQTFNMAPYAGQTVRIKFLVHGDNAGDPTDMFVDDVTLLGPGACGTATNTPIAGTATPTTCAASTPGPWTAAAPVPANAPFLRYAFAQNGADLYIMGGLNSGFALSTLAVKYNTTTGIWTTLASPAIAPGQASSAAYMSGKIYVVGGLNVSSIPQTTLQIYDVATNTWTTGPSIPLGTYGAAAGVFNGKFYVAGGSDPAGATGTTTLQVYDTVANSWSAGTVAPTPYLLGGYTQVGQYLYLVGSYSATPLTGIGSGKSPATSLLGGKNNVLAPSANTPLSMRLDMTSSPGSWTSGPAWTMKSSRHGVII